MGSALPQEEIARRCKCGRRYNNEILYRDHEPSIEIATVGRPWSFDCDGSVLRLVSEAYRIHLAYLFDPLLEANERKVVVADKSAPTAYLFHFCHPLPFG